jgi:hypothetical protein
MKARGMVMAATASAVMSAIALAACGGDAETTTLTAADTTTTGTTGATGAADGGGTLTEQQFREFAEGYSYDVCESPSFKEGSTGGFSGEAEGKGIYYECGPTGGAHYNEFEDEAAAQIAAEEASDVRPQLLVGNVVVEAREPHVDHPEDFLAALSEECGCGEVIG